MNILIIGAAGYLGSNLFQFLRKDRKNFKVYGTDLDRKEIYKGKRGFYISDIIDYKSVLHVIKKTEPDVVIHAAAISSLKICEQEYDRAYEVNVIGTENIVNAIKKYSKKTKLIFMSSDYVFDGKKGNYSEEDEVNPVTAYGKMKVLSENYIKDHLKNYLIIRTANIFLRGGNFFSFLKNNLESLITADYFFDSQYTPTNIDILLEGIKRSILHDKRGVLHIAGEEKVSRFDFASHFADILLLEKDKLIQASQTPKEMLLGKDLSLNISKFKQMVSDSLMLTIRESLYLTHGLLLKAYFNFSDDRGSIKGILQRGKWEEVNYITSKKGYIRGNHYHKETKEIIHVIKGKIKVTLIRIDGTVLKELTIKTGDTIVLLPNIVHTFEILNDSMWINVLSKAMKDDNKDIHTI